MPTSLGPLLFLLLATVLFILFYVYIRIGYRYWRDRGIEYIKPTFPFGSIGECLTLQKDLGNIFKECHLRIKGDFMGMFILARPTILIKGRDLLKNILIRDFNYFADREMYYDEKIDPLSANLFAQTGAQWRATRSKLGTAFTTGKIKMMFCSFTYINEKLEQYLDKISDSCNNVLEVRDLSARYLTDITASVFFGIEVDSINEPTCIFRVMCAKAMEPTYKNFIVSILSVMAPKVLEFVSIKQTDEEVEEFMFSIVRQTINFREKNHYTRQDFMQLLLQMRNGVNIEKSDGWNTDIVKENLKRMSLAEVTANCFIFLVGGFETSSTLVSFCLYELAKHQHYLRQAQQDIDAVLKKHGNKITYESVAEIKYLDLCMDETLRKYPPIPFLQRHCNSEYKIPNTDKVIEKGVLVTISVLGIHFDPKIYAQPEKFDPTRFTQEEKSKRNSMDFLPFGDGPRGCLGTRLGLLISKIGLITILSKYNITLGSDMNDTLRMEPKYLFMLPTGGIKIKFTRR